MKKFKLFSLLAILFVTTLCSCTEQERAKNFGGKIEIKLKPNEKLLGITWKESDMWVLTVDTTTHIQYFRENSSFGIWQGEVIVK